jgi:hypothetical protein
VNIRVSFQDARGFPCPKDGTILTLLPGGAWCPECHTVWREKGEIPLSVAMYEIPSQERIDALEAVAVAARAVQACQKCRTPEHDLTRALASPYLADNPPGSRDSEEQP